MPLHSEMWEFTKDDFHSLAAIEKSACLSMFVPQAGGYQAALEHSAPALTAMLRKAEEALEGRGVLSTDVHKWLAPIRELFAKDLWHGNEQGLALFRTSSDMYTFFVPLRLPSRVIIARRFFLKPLIPCLTRTRRYYILAVSDNTARLFHCREAECVEVKSDKLPESLKAALSSKDFVPKLQGHTAKVSGQKVLTHYGHTAPIEDIHENRQLYCRRIDSAVQQLIGSSSEPLVLACVKGLFAEFQQIHTYEHLVDEPVLGSPDRLSASQLHEAAQRILDLKTQREIARAVAEYTDRQDTEQGSSDAEVIVEAALKGRIRTVFVAEDAEIWGTLNQTDGAIKLGVGNETPEREEFLNLTAIETIRHNGTAYTLPLASMPAGRPVSALLRF